MAIAAGVARADLGVTHSDFRSELRGHQPCAFSFCLSPEKLGLASRRDNERSRTLAVASTAERAASRPMSHQLKLVMTDSGCATSAPDGQGQRDVEQKRRVAA